MQGAYCARGGVVNWGKVHFLTVCLATYLFIHCITVRVMQQFQNCNGHHFGVRLGSLDFTVKLTG